jgi:hypothetical protein
MIPTPRLLPATALALGLLRCIVATAANTAADPAASVFQPTFHTDQATMEAGKGFVLQLDGCAQPVLVTALRLLGVEGSLPAQIPASDLRTRVLDLTVEHINTPARPLSMHAVSVTPANAAPCCTGTAAQGPGDVAAFELPASFARFGLPVAGGPPTAGDHVFLITPGTAGRAKGLRHEAVIGSRASGYLLYDYLESGLEIDAAAGAPLVNAAGEVVAIHIARQKHGRDAGTGVANPVARWLEPLRQACAAAVTSGESVD